KPPPDVTSPYTAATPAIPRSARHAVTSTSRPRGRRGPLDRGAGSDAASPRPRTRARSSSGAPGSVRSSRTRSSKRSSISGVDIVPHFLFEFLQRAREARGTGGAADPEQARGFVAVELEQHAQGDHLALDGRERSEAGAESRRERARELRRGDLRWLARVAFLATPAPLLAADVV